MFQWCVVVLNFQLALFATSDNGERHATVSEDLVFSFFRFRSELRPQCCSFVMLCTWTNEVCKEFKATISYMSLFAMLLCEMLQLRRCIVYATTAVGAVMFVMSLLYH